jgi:hypothetical protein
MNKNKNKNHGRNKSLYKWVFHNIRGTPSHLLGRTIWESQI